MDAKLTSSVIPAIGAQMMDVIHGPIRTWIHRTLQAITDEKALQSIILRLAQASIPGYAQIRHGPIEYGKDVVVLMNVQGSSVLRMYQAKCGDITVTNWRPIRGELEDMFLVPLPDLQIKSPVDAREGVLVTNGHANPYSEPIMQAWFDEQLRVHGWKCEFMHLDRIVQWIVRDRLVNEFKEALRELGIEIRVGGVV